MSFCFKFLLEYVETMKMPLLQKRDVGFFHEYCPATISVVFSAKFVLEYKAQNSIALFGKCQMQPFVTSQLPWISILRV